MGIIKESFKVVNEIVTLGGASRLEEATRICQEAYDRYLVLYNEGKAYQTEIEDEIKAIGDALTNAKTYLERSQKLIEPGVCDSSSLSVSFATQTLERAERFNSGFNSAVSVGVGSIAGGSLAVGSWALVTALGSASTGAALSGLTGVAATNATLAWFGGGALAAGGAGMAGGAVVLGGLFAVPLVYFAAKGSHKKAKELEAEKIRIENEILTLREQVAAFPAMLAEVKYRNLEISKCCNEFIANVIRYSAKIRPHGFFSAAKQNILSLFGKDPYTEQQAIAVGQLTRSVNDFLADLGVSGET